MGERKDVDNTLRSQVDGYGFDRSHDPNSDAYDDFMASYLPVLARRESRWKSLVSKGGDIAKNRKDNSLKTEFSEMIKIDSQINIPILLGIYMGSTCNNTVKRFCRKGIPNEHRKYVWMFLSGAEEKKRMNPKTYKLLLLGEKDTSVVETIALDLHRTFPENIYFSTKDGLRNSLSNVLIAVSHHNPDKGYCQGLNFIAGLLLLIVKDEESVFWLMDCLMNKILPDFYSPGMEAVKAEQELLGEIIKWKDPALYQHMETVGVHWCLVGTKWFMCLFADVLPTETVLRIWDCMFYEGSKVLLRVSAMLILQNRDRLMACDNFTSMVNELQSIIKNPQSLNCHKLMKHCFKRLGSFPHSRIEKMRLECLARVGD